MCCYFVSHRYKFMDLLEELTCVEEESVNERAVTEEGAHRCHIIKVAVSKGRVDEGDGLQLHVDES